MRILIVNDHARVTGGADIHCFEIARLLRERGHEVKFLSTIHPQNLVGEGVFIPQIVDRSSRDSLSGTRAAQVAAAACWNRTAARATARLIEDFSPDVIHAHKLYPQLSVAPVVMAARRGIPIVQTAHDYEFVSASTVDDLGRRLDRDEDRMTYRLLNSLLFGIKRAAHVPRVSTWIAVSRDLADVYRSQGGIEAVTLPNFIAEYGDQPLPFREREGAMFVGRLAPEKGIDQVIDLARLLPSVNVTVAGLGPLEPMVRRAAEEIPNLSFVGALDSTQVAERMRSARLVLMPAGWREPGPLVSLEAMAAGTPIVAYAQGGLGEYVTNAGAGLVVPPELSALVTGVRSLIDERQAWEACSEAAVRAAHNQHSPDRYVERLEAIFRAATPGDPLGSAS